MTRSASGKTYPQRLYNPVDETCLFLQQFNQPQFPQEVNFLKILCFRIIKP